MKQIILIVGCSGSGKTTWAESFIASNNNWVNINRDDERFAMTNNGIRDWSKYKFNKSNERKVTEIINEKLAQAFADGKNIIISDTNLNPTYRENFKTMALEYGYEYSEKPFVVSWVELEKRNANRQGGVSTTILRSQYLRMQDYLKRKTYKPNTQLHKAAIVDVDGTVAGMNGIRKPYEWNRVDQDKPRREIIAMVRGLYESGYRIIFLSGRDGECYDKTQKWLDKHCRFPFELHMRAAGDQRKDYTVKEELFWPLTGKWNITTAIDDRPQVLRLWEELKIQNIISVGGSLYNEF